MLTLPGFIDPHVHLREPGQTEKEDFYTGTSAAIAGGFTTILDMPNNATPITTLERLEEKKMLAKQKIVSDIGFHFGTLGDNFDEFSKVAGKVKGLKIYLNHTTGDFLIDKKKLLSIFQAWPAEIGPILLHAEEDTIAHVIDIVQQTKKRAHICHISSEHELSLVMQAKQQDIPITCGVTAHHLFLSEDDVRYLGSAGMMKPPLKSKKDVAFLWRNLHMIDVIETDHAPHTIEEKQGPTPVFGVPGLETTIPLLLTAVSENRLSIQELIRLCFSGSSHIFGIPHDHGTKLEVDMGISYEIQSMNFLSKFKWTPFQGWKVKGKIIRVYIREEKVYEDGKILVPSGFGKIIP